jgi:hypothetical protein
MRGNKAKTRGKRRRRKAGVDRVKDTKEETRQKLPGFTADVPLLSTSAQRYHLTRRYAQTHRPNISSAQSFLSSLCYYKCMVQCSIICSPPRMCLISCPRQCRAQCGLYGI